MAKVPRMLAHVVSGDLVGALERRVYVLLAFIETVGMTERLQPGRRVVLAMRQSHGAEYGAPAPNSPHQPDQQGNRHIKGQQQRVIRGHEQKTHPHLQQDGKTANEQVGHLFHHDDDVEIAIEKGALAAIVEKRVVRIDGAQRYFRHHAGIKTPTEYIHDVDAQGVQPRGQQQQKKQGERQHEQRRRQADVGHGVDQHLHRHGRGQRQQTDAGAIDHGERVVAALGGENADKEAEQRQDRTLVREMLLCHRP